MRSVNRGPLNVLLTVVFAASLRLPTPSPILFSVLLRLFLYLGAAIAAFLLVWLIVSLIRRGGHKQHQKHKSQE